MKPSRGRGGGGDLAELSKDVAEDGGGCGRRGRVTEAAGKPEEKGAGSGREKGFDG